MNHSVGDRKAQRSSKYAPVAYATLLYLPLAAAASDDETTPEWSVSASRVHQVHSDLDSGGEAGVIYNRIAASMSTQASEKLRVGADVRLEQQEWEFDDANVFGAEEPWDDVRSANLSLHFQYALRPQWLISLSPTVQVAAEGGADTGDALTYGAGLVGLREFAPDRHFGLGFAVYRDIDTTRVLPLVAFSWRFTDRLTLRNPLPTGPAGGGGVELAYALNDGWTVAGGAGYRMNRFRLDDEGPYGDAIAESRGAPVFARLSYKNSHGVRLDAYAGVLVAGELRIEEIAGAANITEDYDGTAPIFGVSFHLPL